MKAFLTDVWFPGRICYGLSVASDIDAAMSDAERACAAYGKAHAARANQWTLDEPLKDGYVPIDTIPKPMMPMLPERPSGDGPGWFVALVRCSSFGRVVHNIGIVWGESPEAAEAAAKAGPRKWTRRSFVGCLLERISDGAPYIAIAETR